MLDLGQPMLDSLLAAAHVEHMRHVSRRWTVRVAWGEGELDAIAGEHRMDFVRDSRDGAINGDIKVELALGIWTSAMSI
jgi:hypothetical protein